MAGVDKVTCAELNEVRTLKKQIAAAKQKVAALRESAESVTVKLEPTPKGTTTKSRLEVLTALIVDTEAEISRLQARLQEAVPELTEKILAEVQDNAEQTLLIYRYVACKYFRDIGFLMGYSERRVYQVHEQTLKKISVDCS